MVKTLFTVVLLLTTSLYMSAQQGQVSIERDPELDRLLKIYEEVRANADYYTIQVGFGTYDHAEELSKEYAAETEMDEFFYNPELALYMDDDQFGGAVPAFASLRIQEAALGSFDFTNGADGVSSLKDGEGKGRVSQSFSAMLKCC